MSVLYLSEIVKFAIEREQESYALYDALAKQVQNQQVSDLFIELRNQEQQHKDFYVTMLSQVDEHQSPGVKEDEQYAVYMQELISSRRDTPVLSPAAISDVDQAIDYAIAREKDAVLFYVGLKNYLPEQDRNKVDSIIAEEGKHIAMLVNARKTLSA